MSRRSDSDTDYKRCNCNKCVKKRRENSCERNICRNCKKREIYNCSFCSSDSDNCNSNNSFHSSDIHNIVCNKKDECQKNKTIIITIN